MGCSFGFKSICPASVEPPYMPPLNSNKMYSFDFEAYTSIADSFFSGILSTGIGMAIGATKLAGFFGNSRVEGGCTAAIRQKCVPKS